MKVHKSEVPQVSIEFTDRTGDSLVTVTEWGNLEGVDVAIQDGKGYEQRIGLTRSQWAAVQVAMGALELGEG